MVKGSCLDTLLVPILNPNFQVALSGSLRDPGSAASEIQVLLAALWNHSGREEPMHRKAQSDPGVHSIITFSISAQVQVCDPLPFGFQKAVALNQTPRRQIKYK